MEEHHIRYAYECLHHLLAKYTMLTIEDKEDLSQKAMLKLSRSWHHYSPARGKWNTFIDRVLRNAVKDAIRDWHRESWNRLNKTPQDDDIKDDRQDCDGDLYDLLDTVVIDDDANQVARLLMEGYQIQEIAGIMEYRVSDTKAFVEQLHARMQEAIANGRIVDGDALEKPEHYRRRRQRTRRNDRCSQSNTCWASQSPSTVATSATRRNCQSSRQTGASRRLQSK